MVFPTPLPAVVHRIDRSAGVMTMSGYVSGSETCTKISAPALHVLHRPS
jgi:hypothetical protein